MNYWVICQGLDFVFQTDRHIVLSEKKGLDVAQQEFLSCLFCCNFAFDNTFSYVVDNTKITHVLY